ncbi:hypothetical protein DYB32_000590 [Aphanomyces invadans]|uniref:Cytosol aminopeptidase domain-containing protein n=1 Tax=Aphanomyces invadans TaxID=157072 RepID=A0A418B9J5_9STRA|nr:hypothetical protein DYB32_000590 [Aphanomyces invadans]
MNASGGDPFSNVLKSSHRICSSRSLDEHMSMHRPSIVTAVDRSNFSTSLVMSPSSAADRGALLRSFVGDVSGDGSGAAVLRETAGSCRGCRGGLAPEDLTSSSVAGPSQDDLPDDAAFPNKVVEERPKLAVVVGAGDARPNTVVDAAPGAALPNDVVAGFALPKVVEGAALANPNVGVRGLELPNAVAVAPNVVVGADAFPNVMEGAAVDDPNTVEVGAELPNVEVGAGLPIAVSLPSVVEPGLVLPKTVARVGAAFPNEVELPNVVVVGAAVPNALGAAEPLGNVVFPTVAALPNGTILGEGAVELPKVVVVVPKGAVGADVDVPNAPNPLLAVDEADCVAVVPNVVAGAAPNAVVEPNAVEGAGAPKAVVVPRVDGALNAADEDRPNPDKAPTAAGVVVADPNAVVGAEGLGPPKVVVVVPNVGVAETAPKDGVDPYAAVVAPKAELNPPNPALPAPPWPQKVLGKVKLLGLKDSLPTTTGKAAHVLFVPKTSSNESLRTALPFAVSEEVLNDFNGHAKETLLLYPKDGQRTLLVGLGDKIDEVSLRDATHEALVNLKGRGVRHAFLRAPHIDNMTEQRVAELMAQASVLSNYEFNRHLSAPEDPTVDEKLPLRDIFVQTPASDEVVTPAFVEAVAIESAKTLPNLRVTVLQDDELRAKGLNMMALVGQAGVCPPRLVLLEYDGNATAPADRIALVGKVQSPSRHYPFVMKDAQGITFDTGGLNLKPTGSMEDMHMDMCGSAAVLGAVRAAAKNGLRVNVIAALALAENAIGSKAAKPHTIVKSLKGLTVEVNNTDAEGRLVLADALTYVQQQFKPHTVIDVATLTGACVDADGAAGPAMYSAARTFFPKGATGFGVQVLHEYLKRTTVASA